MGLENGGVFDNKKQTQKNYQEMADGKHQHRSFGGFFLALVFLQRIGLEVNSQVKDREQIPWSYIFLLKWRLGGQIPHQFQDKVWN